MEWRGLFVAKHPDVYEPSDDTFLLAEAVADAVAAWPTPRPRFLEVGCGAGLVSLAAAKEGARVTATDLNPHAVELATHNGKQNGHPLDVRHGDLLEPAADAGPFDLVAFNPPYLPTAEDEKVTGPLNLAFDGGPDGNETVLRFAAQLARLPAPLPTQVLVIHSSLSDPAPLEAALAKLGYQSEVEREKAFFYERLRVLRFTRSARVGLDA
ncbi:MAG: HemK2/MTQ2 family protein methyltransferase [Thermoplasmatota archaeon]